MFNGYKKDIAAAAPKIEELQEGYPTEGSPSLGIPATQPGAAWFHMITTELLNAIKELGVTPDKNSLNQLATAILTLKFPSGTAFEYLRDKNYSKNDIVFTNNHLYLCMSNNGPATAVVAPETNDSVWQKIPLKQDILDASTSVKGIVQLCDDIEQNTDNRTMAVTPHAVATFARNFSPDYTAVIKQASNTLYTADVNGYVYAEGGLGMTNSNVISQVTLNIYSPDDQVLLTPNNMIVTNGADMSAHCALFIPISKGFKYKVTYIRGNGALYFIPCKEV